MLAYNPSTQETLTFVFPSPGQAASAARVTFVNKGGQAVTVTGGNFVRQVGSNAPGQPTPIGTLPTAVQTALTTASNTATQGSTELVVVSVPLPTPQETQNTANSGGAGTGTVTPVHGRGATRVLPSGPPTIAARVIRSATRPSGTTATLHRTASQNICPSGQFGTPPNCSTCMSPPCE